MPTIVILPGMHGTGELFAEFIAALPRAVESIVVSYPPDRPLNYAELEKLVRASLPVERPYVLLGESFSGPIAVSIAASKPAGLRGLMLVGSFVRNPTIVPNVLCPLISRFPVWRVPAWLSAAFLLGRSATPALRSRLAAAIAKVSPLVWRARLHAVLAVDVAAQLRNIDVPVLYLRAINDRVVARRSSRLINKFLPNARVIALEAPHFMLLARPVESAVRVEAFVRDVSFSF
ncbi:MAG: alpha/beta fold hydrolase [Proteobacteria bacterium]|nr:alpha/beta fold hydrolase [Pseudomonadota bacterium]